MVNLELVNYATGEWMHIDRDGYGPIMEKYLKLIKAIHPQWGLQVVNRYGQVVRDSSNEPIL